MDTKVKKQESSFKHTRKRNNTVATASSSDMVASWENRLKANKMEMLVITNISVDHRMESYSNITKRCSHP